MRSASAYLGAVGWAVVIAGLSLGASWVGLRASSPMAQWMVSGLLMFAASCGCVLLLTMLQVRGADRTRKALTLGEPPSAGSGVTSWMQPIVEEVGAALRLAAERERHLTARLRELEIRLSISEADRRYGEAILHSLQDAVLVTDPFNELTLANASAARLLGFNQDEVAHRPIEEIVKDEPLRKMITDVRQSGLLSKQRHLEHALSGAHGRSGSYDVTIACLPDAHQHDVGGVVTILRDITREKEISQMKSDFVSQASHELRTPIASINAYVEMLLDGEVADETSRREFHEIIKSEADRLSRMIDNMLNISRIEAGIVSVERIEVDFAKVAREVVEMMQPQAKAKNIALSEKIGPLIYTAEADRDMMHQVILNLVSNAIKYTPEGGRVFVGVENDDATRSVLVSVQDTGLGIPPESVDKIFGKFYRIESYKRMAKGTGLGLNLVKHIVETVHHGQVGVTSQVGMGSKFWFTVPYEFQGG